MTKVTIKEKHLQILKSAMNVFSRVGYDNALLPDIAAQAGVSKLTVTRNFGDKAQLYRTVISFFGSQTPDLKPLQLRIQGLSLEEGLEVISSAFLELLCQNETLLRLYILNPTGLAQITPFEWETLKHLKEFLSAFLTMHSPRSASQNIDTVSELLLCKITYFVFDPMNALSEASPTPQQAETFLQSLRPHLDLCMTALLAE